MLFQTRDQGLQFWQTKSNAIVVNDHKPADCIYRTTSQNGEHILQERMPTLGPAPKVILKSMWRIVQEQHFESDSSDEWQDLRGIEASKQEKEMKIETLEEQCSSRSWQPRANTAIPDFEIDLRIEGVPHDIVQNVENRKKKNWIKSHIHT